MKDIVYKFLRSGILSFIIIFLWNVVVSTFFSSTDMGLRLEVNSLFVVYFALRKNESWLPWAILYIEFIQGLFSIGGWGQNVIAGLVILLLAKFLREFINVKHTIASFFFIEVLLLIRYGVASLIWSIKVQALDRWGVIFIEYLPDSLILSLLALMLFKIFPYIWPENKVEDPF